jgi:hypothetical protein
MTNKRRGGSEKRKEQGTSEGKTPHDDSRDYLAGLRSWGLRPHDLVKVTGAGPYEDSWHPEPGDAE